MTEHTFDDRLLYTPEQTAHVTNLSRSAVFRLIATGELESVKVGRARRITRDGIERFVDRLREPDGRPAPGASE